MRADGARLEGKEQNLAELGAGRRSGGGRRGGLGGAEPVWEDPLEDVNSGAHTCTQRREKTGAETRATC